MSDATASSNATVASEARIAPPQGVIRSIIIIVFGISFYLPLVILVYYCNRHKPPLRYRNPFEMALTATAAFLYTCSRCMGSLFVDEISCTFRLLSFGYGQRPHYIHFAIYFPILVFFFDSAIVLDYRIDLFIEIIIAHTVIWIHIVIPLRNTLAMADLEHDNGKFTGTVGILDAYLHTPEGFQAFSTFAKSEFRFECVHAWKTLVDYQLDAPDHLSAFEIYELHIAPNAPLPLDKVISPSILKRYALAFEVNSKYSVAPEEMVRDKNYFAVLLDAVMDKILVDSLPRFQVHPLGAGWNDFVAKYNTQMTLDRVLESELDANGKPILKSKKTMPTIKNDMYRSSGHLIPIESRRESILQSSANADNDDISITASVKLTDLKYHPR
ncbi:hypothetical protein Ae201684P_005307 [Aphanomyces euteiches]|nr:hypothetical protein Ae201684P_005307 [Aphanomyces euteiches]